ncbi:MAG: hypothetical protein IKJ83_04465 [Ruminococcus sp.]|nr:hypothetical protein [Ruminococcus sp.]
MKKYFLSLLCVVFALMLIFVVSGCNKSEQDTTDTTKTTTETDASVEAQVPTASEFNDIKDTEVDTNATDFDYTQDPNELEILTIPNQQDDGSADIPITNDFTVAPVETTNFIQEPTFLPNGEKIELPFVPVQ